MLEIGLTVELGSTAKKVWSAVGNFNSQRYKSAVTHASS